MKSVALHNLGCKVNSYEMDVMQQYLQENNYEIVDFEQKADIYIINTCTVTNIADRKSRQMLHRAKKLNPNAIVVAVGCYVQTAGEKIQLDDGIDLAIGNNRKKDLVPILEAYLREHEAKNTSSLEKKEDECVSHKPDKTLGGTTIVDVRSASEYEQMELEKTMEHTRAYIKVQDGCDQFCSYCIIPYARGKIRSRKPEEVINEVRGLAQKGYKEVVVTGIHLSSYGLDVEGISYNQVYQDSDPEDERLSVAAKHLLQLFEKISSVEGITRIRLGSLEPRIITQSFAKELSKLEKVCPHFHLSLQSGCDSVLKRMNRRYTTQDFLKSVEILRQVYDHPAITTDVITGFPGETQEESGITVEFLKKVQFFEMHVFPYSKRQGTVAATMPGQLTEQQKKARSAVLLELDEKESREYRSFYLGKEIEVLFEQTITVEGVKYQVGHTRNYIKVVVSSTEDLTNQERICIAERLFENDSLYAKCI